jgi:hypothetical protein
METEYAKQWAHLESSVGVLKVRKSDKMGYLSYKKK